MLGLANGGLRPQIFRENQGNRLWKMGPFWTNSLVTFGPSPRLLSPVYHGRRINYSINSQKYYCCNHFHYSHVINSGELQHCNWNCNCNCNLISPFLSAPESAVFPGILSAPESAVFSRDFVLAAPKSAVFSRDSASPAPKNAVFFQGRTSITVMGQLRSGN